MAVDKQDRAGL